MLDVREFIVDDESFAQSKINMNPVCGKTGMEPIINRGTFDNCLPASVIHFQWQIDRSQR